MAVRPDTTQPTRLRLQEAAAYLGVSANTLRRAADAGRMPCRRTPGGHRRFLLSDIQEYLLATSARRSTARCAAPASPDQPQSTRQDAPSLAPRPGDATIPTPGPDTALTSPSGHPAVHLSSAAAEHLMLLARSAASGLDLPLVLIAWRLDSDSALIVASHPPDSVPPLGLRAGDVAPLRLIPLAADILALGKPIICDDLTQPTEQLTTSIDYFHKVLGLTAAAGAPLMDGGRASGLLLCTTTTSPRSFSAADVAFLEQVAHQAAATCVSQESPSLTPPAPGSVRPHAPERAIPAATPRAHRIGPRLSGNPDEHLDAVAGLASRLLHAKSAAIVADAEGRLHTLATAPASGTTDRSAAPWSERALTILQRLRSRGYDRLPPTLPHDAVGTQLRILPLPFDGHTLAYLLYEDDGSGQSPSADLDALASLLGRAVHSHQESSRLTTRVTALEAVIDASVEDRALLDYSAILRATAKRLSELARAPVVDIYAVEGSVLRALVSYEKGGFDTGWQDVVLPLDRYPCSRRAARTGTIARATSLDDPVLTPEGRSSLEKWGYQSQVSAPLMASGRVLGLIEVSDYVPRDFLPEMELIQRLADVAAQALENAALFEQLERTSYRQRELAALGAEVAGLSTASELAGAVADRLRRVLGVARCDVFRLADGFLHNLARSDAAEPGSQPPAPIPLGDYPTTAEAMAHNQVLVISRPDDTRLSNAEREAYALSGYRSEVVLPLIVDGAPYGIIDLLDTRANDLADAIDFLRSGAQLLQAALGQARLLDQVERRSGVLRDIVELGALATQLHALDVSQLLRAVAERLLTTVDAADCDIFTVDGDGLSCRVSADSSGFDETVEGRFLNLDLYPTTAAAIATGEPFVIASLDDPRLSEEERDNYADYGFQSEMGIPLVAADRVVGLIDLFDTRPRDFAEYVDFARSVGQIVAGALANALLLEKLADSATRQRALVDSALDFGATLDVGGVLRAIAVRACETARADTCDIVTLDAESAHVIVSVAGRDDTGAAGHAHPLTGHSMIQAAAASTRPVRQPDIEADPHATETERAEWRRWGRRAGVLIPLVSRTVAIGVIGLYSRRPRHFDDLELLQGLAQIAAQALANADLYVDVQRRTIEAEFLNDLARRTTSSLDEREIAKATIEQLHDLLPFDHAAVLTVDSPHAPRIAYATEPLHAQLEDVDLAVALARAEPELLSDPVSLRRLPENGDDIFPVPALRPMRSVLAVRLSGGEEAIGALMLYSAASGVYTHRECDVLRRVGTHLSVALSNARLYGNIKRLHLSNLRALSSALSAKDYYTLGHAARVAAYMVLLGRELGWPQQLIDDVEEAAYLHDIGKIGIPDRVLLTAAPLNDSEWDAMRRHPVISAEILEPLFDEELVSGVRHHHERHDGGGYPAGLAADDIPLIARAMCVADAYDAMSYQRPYKDPLSYSECRAELERCSGDQFDPQMVRAFLRVLDRLHGLRALATAVAAEAAAEIDVEAHRQTMQDMDPRSPAYTAVADTLRRILDAHPPTRFLVTSAPRDGHFHILVDAGDPSATDYWSPPGEEIFAAGDLPTVYAASSLDQAVLYVDRFGVWVYGAAPIVQPDGEVVGLVTADLPPDAWQADPASRSSTVKQSFASLLHSTAERLGPARLDAITDHLTGLYNHRYLHERLQEELDRAREADTALALLFLDIDHFKHFNDTHGHSTGDAALRAVASAIDRTIRRVDLAARYGGEEFVIVLVDTDRRGALEVAERVRTAIADTQIAPDVGRISVSIGVACYPEDGQLKERLIDKADWAMYMAKRSGRNRVTTFSTGQMKLALDDATAGPT